VSRHWLRPFVNYLIDRRIVTRDDISRVLRFQSQIDKRIGQIATLKGYIAPRDVFYIVVSQVDFDVRFGDLAVQKGLMTSEQVQSVLKLQEDPFLLFYESLLLTRLVPEEDLRRFLKDFLQSTHIRMRSEEKEASADAGGPSPSATQMISARPADQVRSVLRRIKNLATLPDVVQRLLALLQDPDVRIERVAQVIRTDPAFTTQILRLVNSAFFGVRGRVTTIHQAIVTLGTNGVRQIALTISMMDKFRAMKSDEARRLWQHSVLTAQWSQALMKLKTRRRQDLEDVFVAGLMHDLGRFVLQQYFPEDIAIIREREKLGRARLDAERDVIGLTHPDVGAYLCYFWTFPEPLSQAVLYHHASTELLRTLPHLHPLTAIVNAACAIAHLHEGPDLMDRLAALDRDFLAYHDLEPHRLFKLAAEVKRDADQLVGTFGTQ
jgi:putative nucleotidyltransferase with HDIG domain